MIRNRTYAREQDCFFVFDNLLGESDWARRIRRRVIQFARYRFNVLVVGSAGTGKRLVAHALHEHGPRRGRPFIPVDCARLTGNLFRSQLFGQAYEETTTLGCFRSAHGGTLYLANVDQLDNAAQDELLEALESRSVVPTGTNESHMVDVRIVAGSRKDLDDEVRQGRFRCDLFRRLSVLRPIETATLRARAVDIELIATHLVAKLTFERGLPTKQLTPSAIGALRAHAWTGNVGELHAVLDEAICCSKSEFIETSHLPIESSDVQSDWMTLKDVEANHIRDTLAQAEGNTTKAAAMLGISPEDLLARLSRIN